MMLLLLVILFSTVPTLYPNSYEAIRQEILQNFPAIKLNQKINLTSTKKLTFPAVALSDYEKHEALFSLLGPGQETEAEEIIDTKTIRDLNLFFYNDQRPDYTLLEKIYRGSSLNGKMALAALMAHPSSNVTVLKTHQLLITHLMSNQPLARELKALFQEIAAIEENLYSLWNTDDILYTNYVKKTFYSGNFKKYSEANGAFWLEFNRRRKDWKPVIDFLILDTINTIIRTMHMKYGRGMENASAQPGWLKAFTSLKNEEPPLSAEEKKAKSEENLYAWLSTIVSMIPSLIEFDQWKRSMQSYAHLAAQIRQRTRVLITCSTIIQRIFALIANDPILSKHLYNHAAIKEFALGANKKQKAFLTNLANPAFQSNSYHLSYIGKVLHAIPQFLDIKESFSAVFRGIGALEAYVSLASLMQEKATSQTPWCFTRYCQKATPYLAATDYYHPFIPSEKAILNNITLGDDNNPGMVVTGPNASGKSMNIRSIALCVLLGQTLGIAPASDVVFTPISKILTFLNPVDNIAQGRSLFQVEEDRISTIVHSAYNLPTDKFSFIIVDELLSSTAPAEGEAASFGICYGLSKLTNCMPIAATHFTRLTTLPRHTDHFFTNYHVSIVKEENGDITHTFKLEPGRSYQVIAIDLARKAGFDSDILARAEEFLYKKGLKRDRMLL